MIDHPAPSVASEILARTARPAAVATLSMMNSEQANRLLAQLPRPKAAQLQLRFSEWVIGALVDNVVLTLSPDQFLGDVLRLYQ